MLKRKEILKMAENMGYVLEKQDGSHMIYSNKIGLDIVFINHQNTSDEMSPLVTNEVLDNMFVTLFLKESKQYNFEITEEVKKMMTQGIKSIKTSELREKLSSKLRLLYDDKNTGIFKFLSNKAKTEIKGPERNHLGAIKYLNKKLSKNL